MATKYNIKTFASNPNLQSTPYTPAPNQSTPTGAKTGSISHKSSGRSSGGGSVAPGTPVGTSITGGTLVATSTPGQSTPAPFSSSPDVVRQAAASQRADIIEQGGQSYLPVEQRTSQSQQGFAYKTTTPLRYATPAPPETFRQSLSPQTRNAQIQRQINNQQFSSVPVEHPVTGLIFGTEGENIVNNMGVQFPTLFPEVQSVPFSRSPQNIEEVYKQVRLSMPAGQRIKLAYQSAGKGSEAYGVVRAGLEVSSIVSEKIGFDKFLSKVGVNPYKQVSTRPVENFVIGTFFFTPRITATTAQIERELFSVSQVSLTGVSQKISEGTVKTDAGFTVSRAGRSVQGTLSAESTKANIVYEHTLPSGIKLVNTKEGLISGVKGNIYKKSFVFPTTRQVAVKTGSFESAEISSLSAKDSLLFSKGIGKSAGSDSLFKSGAISRSFFQNGQEFNVQVGVTIEKEIGSASSGLFKVTEGQKIFFEAYPSGTSSTIVRSSSSSLKGLSQQITKNLVSKAVAIPPKTVNNLVPVVSLQSSPVKITPSITGNVVRQSYPLKVSNPVTTSVIKTVTQQTDVGIIPKPKQRHRGGARSGTASSSIQKFIQTETNQQRFRQTPNLKIEEIQTQSYKQLTSLKTNQRLRQESRGMSPPRVSFPSPKSPNIPFFYTETRPQSFTSLFNVFVRRQGKFLPVGTRVSFGKAYSLGLSTTQRGLGQTFKIEDVTGGAINFQTPRGYYKRFSRKGILFIEKPRSKINTPSEKYLLKLARGVKGGKKRKR